VKKEFDPDLLNRLYTHNSQTIYLSDRRLGIQANSEPFKSLDTTKVLAGK